MRRTTPLRSSEVPKEVPEWITDIHQDNMGHLEGRVVFHDYAYTLCIEGCDLSKMKEA